MDLKVIDTVRADTLEQGDIIAFFDGDEFLGHQEVMRKEDNGTDDWSFVTVTSENGDEMNIDADFFVNIYGYVDSED
jgi:hypothetical protein